MPVRSSVLARASVNVTTPFTLFTVPAGQTWIIRNILIYNQAAGVTSVNITLVNPGSTVTVSLAQPTINSGGGFEDNTNVTAQAGDSLIATGTLAGFAIWVSGPKLLGVTS